MSRSQPSQSLLLETIKIEDGVVFNLDYHQKRCTQSRKKLYACDDELLLKTYIQAPPKGLYRCRIIYAEKIQSVEYIPYVPKEIHTLKIISTTLDYPYKYARRESLNRLLSEHKDVDDVILEKEGYLTDTTIANIAFYDKGIWYTPLTPLLHGTMRQKLIDEGFLKTRNIQKKDLGQYTQVALMNAMIGFEILKDINMIQK